MHQVRTMTNIISQVLKNVVCSPAFIGTQEDKYTDSKEINPGMPQGAVRGHVYYLICTSTMQLLSLDKDLKMYNPNKIVYHKKNIVRYLVNNVRLLISKMKYFTGLR